MSEDQGPTDESSDESKAIVNLTATNDALDLTLLPEKQRQELMYAYAQGRLDVAKRAADLAVDVKTLSLALDAMSQSTTDVAAAGNSVTMTHTQTSTAGRTEILMGNSEKAQAGKLSKSQTGERDWTPYYIFGSIIAAALVLIAFVSG